MKIDSVLKKKLKDYLKEEILTKNKKYVEIVTAHPLNNESRSLLLDHFPLLKGAELINTVNKDIIGGFIIKFGSTVYDASISGSINHYVNTLYGYS